MFKAWVNLDTSASPNVINKRNIHQREFYINYNFLNNSFRQKYTVEFENI